MVMDADTIGMLAEFLTPLVVDDDTLALEAIRRAGGVITEEDGSQSHAAVIGQRLGIPVIVGVAQVTSDVRQGEVVTLDIRHGVVHRGTHVHDHSSADNIG